MCYKINIFENYGILCNKNWEIIKEEQTSIADNNDVTSEKSKETSQEDDINDSDSDSGSKEIDERDVNDISSSDSNKE